MNLENIKGIGPKTVNLFNKLGIYNDSDLINHYPFRFEDLTKINPNEIKNEEIVTIEGIIESEAKINYYGKKQNKMTFTINSSNIIISVNIFNRGFMKNNIKIGETILVTGKYNPIKKTILANNMRFKNIDGKNIEPIYHTVSGLSNGLIQKAIKEIINNTTIEETLPEELIKKYSFIPKEQAIKILHNPENKTIINKAINRIKYEELFLFMLKINNMIKNNKLNNEGLSRKIDLDKINSFKKELPFILTEDQEKALDIIVEDLNANSRMNRLLLGDVGSGKTIVSYGAIYGNFLAGYQSAFMAPTEILAKQHYKTSKEFLNKYNIKISLITSSTKSKEKQKIYDSLKIGETDLIIGTHALLNNDIKFNNLGLVITDEQHRFGVRQRENLKNKGATPDILYLSATPIPRTYALTIYGDMEISLIKTRQEGRLPIKTKLIKNKNIKNILFHMLEEIKKGHQIYIVSPLIDDEESELKSTNDLKDNIEKAFNGKVKTEIIHGRLKAIEKEKIMNDFEAKKFPVLISTTVIEVGIDIKNTTMMIIFNAERFGLSTLHQLRGRVGRNNLQSYCYLISDSNHERLKVLEEESDGFKIAEADFKLRGHGDIFGTLQSGDMTFKLADLKEDYELLLKAKKDSEDYINEGMLSPFLKNELDKTNDLS